MAMRREPFLEKIYCPQTPDIDFVFVHGLNPHGRKNHAFDTWTYTDEARQILWPKDFLPQDFPRARIWIFGYNANVTTGSSVADITTHAGSLLNQIGYERTTNEEHNNIPIIFICHSLGGLVVKQALLDAQEDPRYRRIKNAARGLVFFGTPHQGGNVGGAATTAAKLKKLWAGDSADNILLKCLVQNSAFTKELSRRFKHQLENYSILTIFETLPTKLPGFSMMIVTTDSAVLNVRNEILVDSNKDHRNCCKFAAREDGYNTVRKNLRDIVFQILGLTTANTNQAQATVNETADISANNPSPQESQQVGLIPQIRPSQNSLSSAYSAASLHPQDCNKKFSLAIRELDTLFIYNWIKNPAVRANLNMDLINSALFELTSAKEQGKDPRFRNQAVKIILDECNLDLECMDPRNQATALILAASSGREVLVKSLIEKGASLQAVDGVHGRTPLSWAARYNALGSAKILLEALLVNQGAKTIQSTDNYGCTALDIARERSHVEIEELLVPHT